MTFNNIITVITLINNAASTVQELYDVLTDPDTSDQDFQDIIDNENKRQSEIKEKAQKARKNKAKK